ncbi:hypothetical protein LXL04_003580 [Taraxacum kok-saghyz]
METLPRSTHSPFLCRKYSNFHSPSKTVKSRTSFIVSSGGVHRSRITRELQHQQGIRKTQSRTPSLQAHAQPSLLEKVFSTLDRAIINFIDPPLHLSVDANYILSDNFAPVDELSPTQCIVHGSIPPCLDGVYIRNGPNPQFPPSGPHHYLDGDGMVHSVKISDGRATFCSRYVKTNKYLFEHHAKSYIVPKVIGVGMLGLAPFVSRAALFIARVLSGQYDVGNGIGVANTSLAFLGGSLYALCEGDLPYAIKVRDDGDIITLGRHSFDGKLTMNMTAHPKFDPDTKEAFSFRYSPTPPYLTYFWFDENGNKQPDVPIFSMKQLSLTHDLAISKKYAIMFDVQLGTDIKNLIVGKPLVNVDHTKVPRIGVLQRYAKDESSMKWFEVPGFNIFHVVNAWDETDKHGGEVVVLVAPKISSMEHFVDRVDLVQASMEKIAIHLQTGVVSRETLSADYNLEFPVINPAYVSKKNKYVYAAMAEKTPMKSRMVRTMGVAKVGISQQEDNTYLDEHIVAVRTFGDNCFGGEPFFVAREPENPCSEEDDGFIVSFVHNESRGESRFVVMDARSPTLEIVASVTLPQRVPYGLHGIFVRDKDIDQ